jgi:hypothetical protein
VLCKNSKEEIYMKPSLGYSKDGLCYRPVDTWSARFRKRKTSLEDDDKSGRPSRADFSAAISGHSERNPPASLPEIAKDLFVPETIISRVLEEVASRLFNAQWVPRKISAESKVNRVDICQGISEVLETLTL